MTSGATARRLRIIEAAERWLGSDEAIPWQGQPAESEIDVAHHNAAYDIIGKLLALVRSDVEPTELPTPVDELAWYEQKIREIAWGPSPQPPLLNTHWIRGAFLEGYQRGFTTGNNGEWPSDPNRAWANSKSKHALSGVPSTQLPQVSLTEEDVEHLRAYCHGTYNGGWHCSEDGMKAFHHGMDTVCNILKSRAGVPSPQPETPCND